MTPIAHGLPDCPQIRILSTVIEKLVIRPDVMAIWLGGSFASGKADRYSDVDLRLAVYPSSMKLWQEVDMQAIFDDPCPGCMLVTSGEAHALYHVILSNGEIFDLNIQTSPPAAVENPIVMLAFRDASLIADIESKRQAYHSEPRSPSRDELKRAIEGYWINTHKHRKVLDRDLDLMAHIGLNMERDVLRRLWYVQLTGLDAPAQQSIHTLTDQIRAISKGLDGHAFQVLGKPLRTREELIDAIEIVRDEIAKVGRDLADKHSFEYPHQLEEVVRAGWREWGPAT